MRYQDPEIRRHGGIPVPFVARPPRGMYADQAPKGGLASRIGARIGGSAGAGGADGDRWIKGVDARPVFEAENRRRGLDGYKTKGEDARRGNGAGAGAEDKDRWDRGNAWNATTKRDDRRSRSPARRSGAEEAEERARSPTPELRPDSPLRGEREYGSDMEMDD